jgi:hypothetical protein
MPVAHPHIHLCCPRQRLAPADSVPAPASTSSAAEAPHPASSRSPISRVAMLQLFDNLLRQRASARHLATDTRPSRQTSGVPCASSNTALGCRSAENVSHSSRAQLLHPFDHANDVVDRRSRHDAVTQVEDMPRPSRQPGIENLCDPRLQHFLPAQTAQSDRDCPAPRSPARQPSSPLSSGVRQSSPITSAPVSRIAGSSEAVSTPK